MVTRLVNTNLFSQCPTSGRWAHCTPVWLRERSSRQQARVKGGVAKASHFSEQISALGGAEGRQSLEGRRCSSSSSPPEPLCSLKYLRQTSWKTARQRVLSRKYHVWCSSSTKLLEAKLRVCAVVPASSNTSSSDSDHLLPLPLPAGDYEGK